MNAPLPPVDDDAVPAGPAPALDAAQRKALKAQAHPLKPVVLIGEAGLTPAVLAEIERALVSHELIKIRVFGDDREARIEMFERICEHTASAPVQHIGKLLVIWRPAPDDKPATSAKGRARPSAPYQPKKAAGAGQAAPTRRAPRTRPAKPDDAPAPRSPGRKPGARDDSRSPGRATTLARGAARGVAGAGARTVLKEGAGQPASARGDRKGGAPMGKPSRPGRAPALRSPAARTRVGGGRKRGA